MVNAHVILRELQLPLPAEVLFIYKFHLPRRRVVYYRLQTFFDV